MQNRKAQTWKHETFKEEERMRKLICTQSGLGGLEMRGHFERDNC